LSIWKPIHGANKPKNEFLFIINIQICLNMFGVQGVLPDPTDREILRKFLTTSRFPQKKNKHWKEPIQHLQGRLRHHLHYAELLDPYAEEIDLLREGFHIQNMYGGKKFFGLIVAYFPKLEQFQVLVTFIVRIWMNGIFMIWYLFYNRLYIPRDIGKT
jgi:hypothetical protein